MKTILATVCMLLILNLLNAMNPPVVSNISAAQRNDSSHILDIYYDLYDADADPITITLEVSDDDGLTWDISCTQVTGAVGTNVSQGVSKHIVWNLGAEHPGISNNFTFRINADDGFVPTVSTPTFSPVAGTYSSAQNVTISCSTEGATIYYTTDGGEPDETSNVYISPIDISATTTLKAKAFKTGWDPSAIATADYTINTVPEGFVLVPGGTFTMGRTIGTGSTNELPTHSVTLNSFYMAEYEVTQGEYQAIMGSNPSNTSYGIGTNYPVNQVSWYSMIKYCNLKSMADGLTPVYTISGSTNPSTWGAVPTSNNTTWDAAICNWSANGYRLPTEAEWEYAARGATNSPDYLYSGSDDINAVAWYYDNSGSTSHPVGTKTPNSLGLHDMSGNLREWCWDWYSTYTSTSQDNPTGASSGSGRVRRGGSWSLIAQNCRIAYRNYFTPFDSFYLIGFRLSRSGL